MTIGSTPLEEITIEQINDLVSNSVAEGRTLEFKLELPKGQDEARKEFLADVSSFANATGGDIVYGIRENEGTPCAVEGIPVSNCDDELLRIESMIRDGIEPRLPVKVRFIDGSSHGPVLLLRIPRSWNGPHVVSFKKWSRFFNRNAAGKYLMDHGEIREHFVAADSLPQKVRNFRNERLAIIPSNDAPGTIQGRFLTIHLIPYSSIHGHVTISTGTMLTVKDEIVPLKGGGTRRFNLDGYVNLDIRDNGPSWGYCQLFRTGIIELVDTRTLSHDNWLPCGHIGSQIVEYGERYLGALRQLNIDPPIVFLVSLHGVRGLNERSERFAHMDLHPVDRDTMLLPEIIIENYSKSLPEKLKPALDALWNSVGFMRSFNFDEDGKWSPKFR